MTKKEMNQRIETAKGRIDTRKEVLKFIPKQIDETEDDNDLYDLEWEQKHLENSIDLSCGELTNLICEHMEFLTDDDINDLVCTYDVNTLRIVDVMKMVHHRVIKPKIRIQ